MNATANVPGTYTYTPAAGTVLNAGANQPLSVAFMPTATANYTTATSSTTLTITKAPLTAKADDKTKVQGTANPPLTIIYTGFVNSENASVLDTPPTISTTAITSSPVGTYPITLAGGSDNNYILILQNGTLTVTVPFDYALSNSGNITVTPGASGSTTITATLSSGTAQTVSFSATGLPTGATATFAPTSCSPPCSSPLTIATTASTPTGTFTITVTGVPLSKTTTFTLSSLATCDIQMTQASYRNGETVTAQVLRLANPGATQVSIEIGIWFDVPGFAPITFVNVGADGSVVLPPGFSKDFGPLALATVTPAFPRGSYAFSCRMVDPVTGKLLSEEAQPFDIR